MRCVLKTDMSKLDSRIFDGISAISDRRYIVVTDLKNGSTRFTKNAVEYFGVVSEYEGDFAEYIAGLVHSNDLNDFMRELANIYSGKRRKILVDCRLKNKYGEYVVCTIRGILDNGDMNDNDLLILSIENHSISDNIDATTGLYNIIEFWKYVRTLQGQNESAVLLFIGIQNFTQINHIHGYNFGDKVLHKFADILMEHAGEGDKVFRAEGVSFIYCFKGYDIDKAQSFYEDLQQHFKNDIYVDDVRIAIAIAGGVVLFNEDFDEYTAQTSGKYALSRSKYEQLGELVVYDNELFGGSHKTVELMGVLRKCILNDCEGFYLCYQSIIDAQSEKIVGAEALLRWKGEPYGEVPPGMFIEWLENDITFIELGYWILYQGMMDGLKFIDIYPDFKLNINITYTQLANKEFKTKVVEMMKQLKYPAKNLCLELTERCRLIDTESLRADVDYFKSIGITVAIDDFGTGYSALNLLSELNVDVLKFDYGFTKDLPENKVNQILINAMTKCASELGIKVCFEGMETRELIDFVKQYPVHSYQGYYFSKPIVIEQFYQMLQDEYKE